MLGILNMRISFVFAEIPHIRFIVGKTKHWHTHIHSVLIIGEGAILNGLYGSEVNGI